MKDRKYLKIDVFSTVRGLKITQGDCPGHIFKYYITDIKKTYDAVKNIVQMFKCQGTGVYCCTPSTGPAIIEKRYVQKFTPLWTLQMVAGLHLL